MITKELVQELLEVEKIATQANKFYPLNKAYKYSPRGYHDEDFAVAWDGAIRIAERVSEQFADVIVAALRLSIISRNNIRALCESWLEQEEKINHFRRLAQTAVHNADHQFAKIAEDFRAQHIQAQDALEKACEALEFYADDEIYQEIADDSGVYPTHSIESDQGTKATRAINASIIQAARRKK